ncbi:MAG: DNA polymerase IV, partial [Rhodoferax sp.]
ACQCLKRAPLGKRLRLLGVRVAALRKHSEVASQTAGPQAAAKPGTPSTAPRQAAERQLF